MKGGSIWLIGIGVLIASFIGYKMLVSGSSAANDKGKHDIDIPPPDMVVCWGYFDGEKGVIPLDPQQFGQVEFVVAENAEVKKGDVLLQVNDKIVKLKAKAAQLQLDGARQLPRLYKLQEDEAQASLDAAVRDATAALKRAKDGGGSPAAIQEAKDQLADKKKAGEAKIEQIKLQNAPLKIAQAETQLNEAETMVKYFQVVAPEDGIVLRVNVHKGETLGPNAMKHAIEFLPKAPIIVTAEVIQEWGRYVKLGQEVIIEDDVYNGPKWTGTVKSLSKWYAPIRSVVPEPFRLTDVRTMNCIIEVKNAKDARIGQRVRAKINIGPVASK